MKPRRSLAFLFAVLLVAAGWIGAVVPVLAATAHHCRHAEAAVPSAPCCGDCTSLPDCAQVCAPLFIAPVPSGPVAHAPQPAPAGFAVAAHRWTALPQTRPPIA